MIVSAISHHPFPFTQHAVPPASHHPPIKPPDVRIALVDDSELVRLGLRTLIENQPGMAIVGEAGSARHARELLTACSADVVLLDIRLPDSSGLDVCRYLQTHAPDTRVIFLTSATDARTVDEAIRAGAHGYLLKEIDAPALIQAIRTVAAGAPFWTMP